MALLDASTVMARHTAHVRRRPAVAVAKKEKAPTLAPIIHRVGVTSSVELVTPETARLLRDNCNFDRQRKISQSNIERLSSEMAAGRFIPGTQVYLCEYPDGKRVIVNGNHTLEAVHHSGVAQLLTLTVIRVADIDAAGRLYAVFDIHKARTWLDSLKATGLEGDNATNTSKVLAAIGVIENRFDQSGTHASGSQLSRLGRIERMAEYDEAARMLFTAIDGASAEGRKYCVRASILAVALETFRYQPSLAAEFWRTFALDNGLVPGMPEKALLGFLRNNRSSSGHGARKTFARAAAAAWNAKFRGHEISMVKPNLMASFFIEGTRWAKGLDKGAE